MGDCRACQVISGEKQTSGGIVHQTSHWWVEHPIGRFGLGTLFVKPKRHVGRLVDVTDDEIAEMGPLLVAATRVVGELVPNEQIYCNLWSYADGAPVHLHFVVQPLTSDLLTSYGVTGPRLQAAMLDGHPTSTTDEVEQMAERARAAFAARLGS